MGRIGRMGIGLGLALGLGLGGCGEPARGAARPALSAASALPAPARCVPKERRAVLDAFVAENRTAYGGALAKARAFLDGLEVDPVKLRAVRIKGKKKLAEAVDAYYRLFLITPPEARPALLARVKELARPTEEERYHDLLLVNDRELKEDATSYLRVAMLLDRMGVDIKRYREEIKNAKWRLDAQMKERGPHQRRAFHQYYQHFGLAEPFALEGALNKGLIAGRADPDKLPRLDVYAVTHEIYTPYDFGERLDVEPFDDADRAYLRVALPKLMATWLEKRDPDLVAELVVSLRYVRFTDEPSYVEGLRFLLSSQNADGSWGSYESMRARLGEYVKQGFYLHSTMVAIEAVTLAFEDVFRKSEGPTCG